MYSEVRNDPLGVSFYVLSEMQNADSRQHKIMPELQGVCCDVGYACFRHGERPVFTGGDLSGWKRRVSLDLPYSPNNTGTDAADGSPDSARTAV